MLTAQQTDFITALLTTTSNLALVARAGCGKTFTIMEAVKAYAAKYPDKEMVVAAYNVAIKDEIAERLKEAGFNWRQVQASTAHGLGFSLLKVRYKPEVNQYKVRDIIRANEGKSPICAEFGTLIAKWVAVAKQAAVGYFPDMEIDDTRVWLKLAEHYGLVDDMDEEDTELLHKLVAVCQWVYKRSAALTSVVDYDDMILLPLLYNLRVRFGKDVVFVDEAQDLSRSRQVLLRKFVKPATGRMVIVGDDRQAIYGFSGADSEALPRMIQELGATVLPLNVTWRCGKAIVAEAQKLVPDFTAAESAPAGAVTSMDELPAELGAGDAILCRNTAPLIEMAYELLRKKVGVRVEGRDIGEGLKTLAQRWKVSTTATLLERLSAYEEREVAKAQGKDDEAKVERIKDKVNSLRFIVEEVNRAGKKHLTDVLAFIDDLFGDGVKDVLTLCSYHRSKGREWRRVFLLEHSQRCPSKWAKRDHEFRQEQNLAYVATTRAKELLVYFR